MLVVVVGGRDGDLVATALLGGWTIVGTFVFLFTSATPESIADNGAKMVLDDHPLWFIIFAVVAAAGMSFQFLMNRSYEVERYNRWDVYAGGTHGTPSPTSM